MGNSASSGRGHHEDTVDFGYLTPQGIYTGPRDWNQAIVTQLIVERKLAPFYRPLEEYEDPASSSFAKGHAKRPSAVKEPARNPEAAIYRGAMECPICFLYYPPNINHSRCCDQAICTECFVQIKRVDPTATHLVSEPAACPYCVQENFGIVYTPPPWRTGMGSEGAVSSPRRRKSFGHNDPEVVTVDHIHPDWEAKLAAVRAAVQRRANRRIIMRQVGDQLIPIGVTSGRVHALPTTEEGGSETPEGNGDRGSRRARRRQQNQEINQLLGTMGIGGQDLEELMVMEAMRLSLLEHEAQQRRQQEEEAKKRREEGAPGGGNTTGEQSGEAPSASSEPGAPSAPVPANESTGSAPQLAAETGSAPRSRTSTSSRGPPSSGSGHLSPTPGRPNGEQSSGRRSGRSSPPSQYGISAVVLSAASTATAVANPSPEYEPSDPLAEVPPTSAPTTDGNSGLQTPSPDSTDNIPTISEPSESSGNGQPVAQSPHPPSFASSAYPSYDVLPSSPESSISDKPLLDSPVPPTSAPEGEPSTAAAS
ncbi:hypothetical protein LXA43DRAFT_975080 [Ganoderma leucocontextum]|nr:hypothetical protein LXA43DRAFT_975080 [Ganoderma leucocontextum]